MPRRRPAAGDLFAVRLADGSFGLGQLRAARDDGQSLVLYRARSSTVEELTVRARLVEAVDAVAVVRIATRELSRGDWPTIARREIALDGVPDPAAGVSYTGETVDAFLEAFHGLRRWDELPAAPGWYTSILLPDVAPPDGERAWLEARLDEYARVDEPRRRLLRADTVRAALYRRYARLPPPDRDTEPARFVERVLLVASLCDGHPDPREHLRAVAALRSRSGRDGDGLEAALARIAAFSSERVRLLFAGQLDERRW